MNVLSDSMCANEKKHYTHENTKETFWDQERII